MKRTFPDLVDWSFEIDEVSAGVYRVDATDERGRRVSRTGIDPEELIDECRLEVLLINRGESSGLLPSE